MRSLPSGLYLNNFKPKSSNINKVVLTRNDGIGKTTAAQPHIQELRKLSSGGNTRNNEKIQSGNNVSEHTTNLARRPSSILSSEKKVKKKSVSFATKRKVRKILPLSAMSESIIGDCWFLRDDFDFMKREFEHLLFFMDRENDSSESSSSIDEDTDSTRGLEHKTQEGKWQRYQHRQAAFDAVINEQERQRTKNIDAPSIIAQVYKKFNTESYNIALQTAKEDEKAVREYLSDMAYPCERGKVISETFENGQDASTK